jgi:glycerophosphoryl diester phosphodiesterase
MPRPLLLGHRGARATRIIPENTIDSFDIALAHGCDGFEFDVRRTADGRAVIFHDAAIAGLEISKAGPGILTTLLELREVLSRYAGKAFLDIELKVPGLEHSLVSALRAYAPQRGFVVSSFLPEVLETLAALDSALPLGLLSETPSQLARWKYSPANFILPHCTQIDTDLCRAVHAAGKKIFTWTVNAREEMLRLASWGVDGIISDETELLVATLKGGQEHLGPENGGR